MSLFVRITMIILFFSPIFILNCSPSVMPEPRSCQTSQDCSTNQRCKDAVCQVILKNPVIFKTIPTEYLPKKEASNKTEAQTEQLNRESTESPSKEQILIEQVLDKNEPKTEYVAENKEQSQEIITEPTKEISHEEILESSEEQTQEFSSELLREEYNSKELLSESQKELLSESQKELLSEPQKELLSEPQKELLFEPQKELINQELTQEVINPDGGA